MPKYSTSMGLTHPQLKTAVFNLNPLKISLTELTELKTAAPVKLSTGSAGIGWKLSTSRLISWEENSSISHCTRLDVLENPSQMHRWVNLVHTGEFICSDGLSLAAFTKHLLAFLIRWKVKNLRFGSCCRVMWKWLGQMSFIWSFMEVR